MAEPKIKTIGTQYIIKVNNEMAERKPSLREARLVVKNMPINDSVHTVHIIKQTITEALLDTYESKVTKVLVACELDNDLMLTEGESNDQ